ncbi:chemotaxis protein CheB [Sansalvadorimonas sp. 2012CJ34-2]|uniref:protein-glutamate methylesterase n=1 Tax=Parendozoicomonas callyspongiae TaxID=2942213 RepID=A0ABT0PE71_9GAMM|nr:chemotaxis protein CheB [Sansalvadorimonas sp. 2012CJ34-2]MCL6269077.1 chemotaxis protein CheB [Sansalvadorimonas sp. 2012CJ34-2]
MKIVVIGASAGGSRALETLLSCLPADFSVPILLVKHHDSGSGTDMVKWLHNRTTLDVHLAEDKEHIQAGSIIVAPPSYHLLLETDGSVSLSIDEPVMHARPSLDVLFESAALAFGDEVLCLVLTGASRDGAEGAEAIRKAGGKVYVQDPETAEVPVMPRAALGKSGAGFVLGLSDLTKKLLEFANE